MQTLSCSYLESGGQIYSIRPWFWVALLFFGRIFKSVSDQWFMFKHVRRVRYRRLRYTCRLTSRPQTRISVRIQAIITELVFEHALRIRMRAETSESQQGGRSGQTTAMTTPDTASQVEADNEGEGGDRSTQGNDTGANVTPRSAASISSTTVASSSPKGKGKAPSEDEARKPESSKALEDGEKGKNLVGRINNLVTSDVANLEPIGMFLTFCRASLSYPAQYNALTDCECFAQSLNPRFRSHFLSSFCTMSWAGGAYILPATFSVE